MRNECGCLGRGEYKQGQLELEGWGETRRSGLCRAGREGPCWALEESAQEKQARGKGAAGKAKGSRNMGPKPERREGGRDSGREPWSDREGWK